jgi:Uma2 family endonuclease
MELSPDEYLKNAFKQWLGDREGDFDYVDGVLVRHDWGDGPHARMHAQLMGVLTLSEPCISVLPSLTLQITPTRFRVPDLVIYDHPDETEGEMAMPPLVVIEILSPEDTILHVNSLEADYRQMGISNIWIIDPRTRSGWICEVDGWIRTTIFFVPGTSILIDLSSLHKC